MHVSSLSLPLRFLTADANLLNHFAHTRQSTKSPPTDVHRNKPTLLQDTHTRSRCVDKDTLL